MNKIRIYVKSEEIEYKISNQLAVKGHPCYGFKKEVFVRLPKEHERAKKIAEEVAKEKGLDLEILDLQESFKKKISAFFRGIKNPSIEIANRRVNGVPSKEKLLTLLNEKETLKMSLSGKT